jgi:hypothetical protein
MSDDLKIPKFETKDELFKFLKDNNDTLQRQKKAKEKQADSVVFVSGGESALEVTKAVGAASSPDELKVKVVINTTNILDSHGDVHQVGIWNKSVKDNGGILFLQEHRLAFDKIIADGDELRVSVQTFTWKELGFNFTGNTEALVFDATIKRDRNPEMFKQYANGWVKEHSVGMRYMQLVLCVNSEKDYYGAEKEAWDKYISTVVNKELAEERGWFYAVKEAKVIEGSAVPKGSNYATPTLEVGKSETVEELKAKIKILEKNQKPSEDTSKTIEPSEDTQQKKNEFYFNLLKQ